MNVIVLTLLLCAIVMVVVQCRDSAIKQTWVQIPALSLTESPNLLNFWFLMCKIIALIVLVHLFDKYIQSLLNARH